MDLCLNPFNSRAMFQTAQGIFIITKQRIKNTFIGLPKLSKLGDITIVTPLTETSFSVVNISPLSLTVVTIFNSNVCKCSLTA